MLLRGRCRNCKERISLLYPALELFTVLGTIVIVKHFDNWFLCSAWVIFLTFGLALSVIDQRNKRLPNVLTFPLYLILVSILGLDTLVNHHGQRFLVALASSLLLALFYTLLNVVSRGGMGLGDAKLALSVGLLAGYISGFMVFVTTFTAFFLGALIGVVAIAFGRSTRKTALAFGPFIFCGLLLGPWVSPSLEKLLQL